LREKHIAGSNSDEFSGSFNELHIGLDDIDSTFNGCTTHITYLIVKELLKLSNHIEFIDYPNLVRLNPSIPFKTRGNGAVALRIKVRESLKDTVVNLIVNMVREYVSSYDVKVGSEPGIAINEGDVPEVLVKLYLKALTDYVHIDYVRNVISKLGSAINLPLGISRGVVGALAAIGGLSCGDCTYELIAYRDPTYIKSQRCIDPKSVEEADSVFKDFTFNNYDHSSRTPLITPHGSDPVLLGIRGDDPKILTEYLRMLRVCEPIVGWMIFRTNQGTDAHLVMRDLTEVKPFRTGCVRGVVTSRPKVMKGGHVLLKINDNPPIHAVIYSETSLTSVARKLLPGDEVVVCGSVRYWDDVGNVINVEKFYVDVKYVKIEVNPRCPKCGKRMKSAGRGKGFKCVKCGVKIQELSKEEVLVKRDIKTGLYIVNKHSMKHLLKPPERYGRERNCTYVKPVDPWIM